MEATTRLRTSGQQRSGVRRSSQRPSRTAP